MTIATNVCQLVNELVVPLHEILLWALWPNKKNRAGRTLLHCPRGAENPSYATVFCCITRCLDRGCTTGCQVLGRLNYPKGERGTVMSVSVCGGVFVSPRSYLRISTSDLLQIICACYVTYDRESVLLWRRRSHSLAHPHHLLYE